MVSENVINYTTPIVNYKSIKIDDRDILLSGSGKASFQSPYNKIDIVMAPTNCSISYYEVRITKADEDYDIGVGALGHWSTNIPSNEDYKFSINVNSTNFSKGDGIYRISLYAKGSIDGSWDVTYLFFTIDSEQFEPSDADGYEVLTDRAAPTI